VKKTPAVSEYWSSNYCCYFFKAHQQKAAGVKTKQNVNQTTAATTSYY